MLHYAAWFVVISCLAVFFDFGGLATGSAEKARLLGFLFLVIVFIGVVATLILNRAKGPSRPRSRHDHFRRIRSEGRVPD